ncbi:retrovirus-related pol polyprotein from transposon TNT 1-94 [Tanacetum coccineum]
MGTNEAVKTAHGVSAANSKNNASTLPNVDSLSDARDRFEVADGNADNESKDISQEDRKQSRAPRNQDSRNTEITRRIMPVKETTSNALVSQCSSSSSSSDTEVSTCSKACLKSYETLKEHYDNLTTDFNKSQLNVGAYKAGIESVEARLDVYKKNEAVFEENIKILKLDIMLRDNALTELRKKFEKAKKERDDLKLTLEKFKKSSKNLSKLLDSQVSDKFKIGVRYDSQVYDSQVFDSQENNKYKTCEGYHAAPPPYTKNFMPPKPDLVLADEYDFSNENETESKSRQRKPSNAKVEFVKTNEHVKSPRESVKKVENNKQAKYPRKNRQSPRGNKRNWNNLMTQKLGSNFEFKNKACYVCGSFNHLIKDCDFYEKKIVEKHVWNNARRVNHQNSQRMTHPHPKRNFVPRAVLMKYGLKTLNTARQNSSRAAVSVNTARLINIAYPRLIVNSARTASNVFNRAHSHIQVCNGLGSQESLILLLFVHGNPQLMLLGKRGNKPNVAGSGSEWLFDIDTLTKSMNYKPVVAGNETNGNAGTKESNDTPDSPISSSPKRSDDEVADDAGKKTTKDPANEGDKDDQDLRDEFEREFKRLFVQGEEAEININNTNNISVVISPINTVGTKDADDEPMMPNLKDTDIFGDAYDDEDFVAGGDINNLESSMSVSPIETTRVHKDHPVEQIIRDLHSAPQTRRMTKNSEEHGLMNVKSAFLYGKIEEELYVCQPPGFKDLEFPDRVYKRGIIDKNLFIKKFKGDIILVQVYVDDIIFRSTKKELCTEFEKLMHKKFQMSYMGKLTFFLGLQVTQKDDGIFISQDKYVDEILKKFGFSTMKITSTPMKTSKPLMKDENAEDVDV